MKYAGEGYCVTRCLASHPSTVCLCSWTALLKLTGNFDAKRLTSAVFLDVAKAFDTVWIDSLFYKLTILNYPSRLVRTTLSYFQDRTFEVSFQIDSFARCGMRSGVAQVQ